MTPPPSTAGVAAQDRELFDSMARYYCRKDLLAASRKARQHRLLRTMRHVPLTSSWNILEIGCGAGFAASYLQGRFGCYRGIDHSAELIAIARRHHRIPDVEFQAVSLEQFNSHAEFDLAFMIGALHHMADPLMALRKTVSLVRSGGWIVVNEPQSSNHFIQIARRLRKRIDRNYSSNQITFELSSLASLFQHVECTDVKIVPQGLISTPFAEVIFRPALLARALAVAGCATDTLLESSVPRLMARLSWNLVAVARKP